MTLPNTTSPIGVFDSGVGGLSVLRALRTHLPAEDFLYVADTAYAPYGEKSEDEIAARCIAIGDFLVTRGVKAIVIACNTATAAAATQLRARYTLPIIALEPAVKPAVAASRSGIVGVLATQRTLEAPRFQELVTRFAAQAQIILQPCPQLVTLLESGADQKPAMQDALKNYLTPLLAAQADALVLGCTHFVFLRPQMSAIAGNAVRLFDSSDAVAQTLRTRLHTHSLQHTNHQGSEQFYSSAATPTMQALMQRLWQAPLTLQPLA